MLAFFEIRSDSNLVPSDVHHAAWPLGGRRAAVVAHRVVRMSGTRKMLLRPLSKNGTIGFPVENWYRIQSVRSLSLSYVTLPYMVT